MSDDLDLAALRRVAEAANSLTDAAKVIDAEDEAGWYTTADLDDYGFCLEDRMHIAAFSPSVALALLARLEAAERDVAKLRRFLKISRDEGLEALTNAATFKEQRDEARRQVQWLTLFGAVADIEAEWRTTQKATPDAPR